jgi:hypothetical protein
MVIEKVVDKFENSNSGFIPRDDAEEAFEHFAECLD